MLNKNSHESNNNFDENILFSDIDNKNLTPEEILIGLLDFGLFSEKVPPCFTSKGLHIIAKELYTELYTVILEDKNIKKFHMYSHDYIRYDSLRNINIVRQLGIPHPESYAIQALVIEKYWGKIKEHCEAPSPKISRIHIRRIGDGRIFEMNYKNHDEVAIFEEDEIEWRSTAKFIIKADITQCFPSIYTHSIPWAIHGLEEAKKSRSHKFYGNTLDKCTQILRDNQTNGLLIGPHSSNLISEIILTKIDNELQKKYDKFIRHIDDYRFYANNYEEGMSFLRDLRLVLRKYEMTINDKKTEIISLPSPLLENWVDELNKFYFPEGKEIKFITIRSFLDLALKLSQKSSNSAILNYAIKMINGKKLDTRAKRLYVQEIMNLSTSYPYLMPLLDKFVFEKFKFDGINEKIKSFITVSIKNGIEKIHTDVISHSIYLAMKYKIKFELDDSVLSEIVEINDCIANFLLLKYAGYNKLQSIESKIKRKIHDLKFKEKREQDKNWLLIYEVWEEKDLEKNGKFLSELKKKNFNFFMMEKRK